MTEALLSRLRAAVGAANVLTEGDLGAWEQDWRKRTRGKALAVVRPGSTEEVAAVVRACAEAGTPIVPQGGNTGLVVGGVPDESGRELVLSLTRLNKVRAIDPANLTMTVDAGCVLQNLQQAAEDAGFLFPLSLAAEGSCTIGGNLGTNAGSTWVPPALVARLPPMVQLPSAARLRGNSRPASSAACCRFCSTQPASTVIVRLAGSMARTLFRRVRLRTTSRPDGSGTPPTTSPVLPPCGTIGVPASAQARTTAATSSAEPGRTTASALPRMRLRQSSS